MRPKNVAMTNLHPGRWRKQRRERFQRVRAHKSLADCPDLLMIGFFLVVPVGTMLVYSFLTKEFRGGVILEFSLAAYDRFIFDRGLFGDEPPKLELTYITIFARSMIQAAVATVLCLIIGFPTAFYVATRLVSTRAIWLFLISVPYWVNLLVRTVSMKFLIRESGPLNTFLQWTGVFSEPLRIINTDFAVQLGLFYSYLPFMVLPMVKPGIVAGCILVFVPSLGEFLAPDLLGGAKNFMIGSLIEEQFKGSAGNWPFGAAASMILLSMVLVVLLIYARRQSGRGGA